jgi:hypothetical protein
VDSIGVDLHSVGVGLPAYWSFSVRILDAVGSCRSSPFYPLTPESPRLHFLGAVWFHTLLVNTNQQADAVYAEVGRLVDRLPRENGPEALPAHLFDSEGIFAANQILWVPPQGTLFKRWRTIWRQALKLGFQLVHTGLRVNATWDGGHFLDSLENLRNRIHTEMFSTPVVVSQPGPAVDNLEVTQIIKPVDNSQFCGTHAPQPVDDDSEITLIQSSRKTSGPNGRSPSAHKGPPAKPAAPPVQDRSLSDQSFTDGENEAEDITEQTIINWSDVKKE